MTKKIHIGIVGAGSFSGFAASAFSDVKEVALTAITDVNSESAESFSKRFKVRVVKNMESMLTDASIDLVYIATPPFLHYQQTKKALLAGKHVICEKPAALKTAEAEELGKIAGEKKLTYVVNLIQRYNPFFKVIDTIVKNKIIGDFIHGYFENYASDQNLKPDHWFWSREKSGGIFIEHGVHFFDVFAGWLGKSEVLNATQLTRPGNSHIIDRVMATLSYGDSVVSFYHGFDQPDILDRQQWRLLFERGDIMLSGWIPIELTLHGLVTDLQLKKILKLLPDIRLNLGEDSTPKRVVGRFKSIQFEKEISFNWRDIRTKQERYKLMLQEMLKDQVSKIMNPAYTPVLTSENGIESLRLAESATEIGKII